jgi:hypothetical protein
MFFRVRCFPRNRGSLRELAQVRALPTIARTMVELHTPVFVYEPRETPTVDFDTLGRFRLHFIATDRSSVFLRMDRQMLHDLRIQIAEAVERT